MTRIKHMSKRGTAWAGALACLVFAQAAASLFLRRGFALIATSDLVQLALLCFASASCVSAALRSRSRTRLFWGLMGLGLASWSCYQGLWTYLEVLKRQEVPGLFIGDAILFLHIVPMMAALALQPNVQQDDRDLRLGSLDFALLLLWWLYLYAYSVLPWQYIHPNQSAYDLNLKGSYSTEQLAFVIGVAYLWAGSSGLWKNIYANWLGASLLYSLGSYIANSAIARGRYYSGSLYDVPLAVAVAWMAVPAVFALKQSPDAAKPSPSVARGVWAARLGMIAVFSLPIFAGIALSDAEIPASVRTFRLAVTLAGMVLMGGLVFLKQHYLDLELISLLQSSQRAFEEAQRLQTQLIQSEKLASLGQLVGGAAHELNNPLTALLGYSELLGNTELTPEQRTLSDKISHQAKRVRGLVASLLTFAKQGPSAKTSIDLNSVLRTALKLYQPQMQASRVQTSIELPADLPIVMGDANQLLQVFSHIISNAVSAMPEGGSLHVSSAQQEAAVVIQFSDTGPGVGEPDRVFDPFYTTRPVGQGTGLGLSACYGIIQDHGGKISCSNRRDGGAVFIIELPVMGRSRVTAAKAEAHAVR
jgi:signal transduction histidine kinase